MNFFEFKEKIRNYPVFSSDILDIISPSPQILRNQINRWRKRKLIISLKRGLYTLNPNERSVGLSSNFLANNLYIPSYVSLESALSFYKLIPEGIFAVTSITSKKTNIFKNTLGTFIYRNLKKEFFFGFKEEKDEYGYKYLIAEPEKALLDYIYLNLNRIIKVDKDFFNVSMRLQNNNILNTKKIKKYAGIISNKKITDLLEFL